MESFGDRLRQLRLQRGLTTSKLADALGVGHSYISNLECGLSRPSEELVRKIAEFFGEDEEYLGFLARGIPRIERARRDIEEVKRRYPTQAPEYLRKRPVSMLARATFEAGGGTYLPVSFIRQEAMKVLAAYSRKLGRKVSFPVDAEDVFYVVFGLETFYDSQGILESFGRDIIGGLYPEGHDFLGRDKRIVVNLAPWFTNFSKRFTIAHEGGHYVLHWLRLRHRGGPCCTATGCWAEWQANRFAGELLMPAEAVSKALDGKKKGDFVKLEHCRERLRDYFGASEAMVEKRLLDLGYRVVGARYSWASYEWRLFRGEESWDDLLKLIEKPGTAGKASEPSGLAERLSKRSGA